MPKETLGQRQKKFINEYLKGVGSTKAAINAGYSKKTAASMGSENLQKPKIKAEIERRQQKAANKADIKAADIIAQLKRIADKAEKEGEYGPSIRALELLGKTKNLFKEQIQHEFVSHEAALKELE